MSVCGKSSCAKERVKIWDKVTEAKAEADSLRTELAEAKVEIERLKQTFAEGHKLALDQTAKAIADCVTKDQRIKELEGSLNRCIELLSDPCVRGDDGACETHCSDEAQALIDTKPTIKLEGK